MRRDNIATFHSLNRLLYLYKLGIRLCIFVIWWKAANNKYITLVANSVAFSLRLILLCTECAVIVILWHCAKRLAINTVDCCESCLLLYNGCATSNTYWYFRYHSKSQASLLDVHNQSYDDSSLPRDKPEDVDADQKSFSYATLPRKKRNNPATQLPVNPVKSPDMSQIECNNSAAKDVNGKIFSLFFIQWMCFNNKNNHIKILIIDF